MAQEVTGKHPADCCVWLYGVIRHGTAGRAMPGVAGEAVRAVREAGLTALAGFVPLSEFGRPAVRRNLENLEWLAAVARAHDGVVRAAMEHGPVVPVRLVTLFSDEAAVRALLRERGTDFEEALERLSGRTEWGVKVFADSRESGEGSAAAAPGEGGGSGPGASYLSRRRATLGERDRVMRAAAGYGERLHERLATLAVALRRHGLRSAMAPEGSGTLLLNDAYLVDDRRFAAFRDAATADPGQAGVRVELTGPWPPYSFASVPGLTDV
jgi:hypothetical protein